MPAVDAEAFDFEHPALPQSAAWRVTRPGKSPQQRPLTVTLAALSVVAALGEPHIDTLLNRLGLTAEHLLFKHVTGIVAAGSVLDFVANMADRGTDPHSRRIRYGLGGLTGTIMIAVSPFIPRGPSGRGFEVTNTDQTSVFLYWVFWLGYPGTAVVLATRLCCEQVRAASPGRLCLGLGIIGTGTAIGCGYILNKLTFVALGYLPWLRLPLSGPRTEMINDFLLYISLFLSVVGTTVPTQLASCMASPILRLQEQRDLELLRPLWLALTRSRPDVVLREVPKGNTRLQRYRCVIEIDDAALTLQEYRQPEMEKAARAAGRNAGLSAAEADAFAEAAQLEAARNAGPAPQAVAPHRLFPRRQQGLRRQPPPPTAHSPRLQLPRAPGLPGILARPHREGTLVTTTDPAISAPDDRTAAHRIARVITEAFAPGILVVVILLAVGWYSTRSLTGTGWGLLAALFCGIIPYGFIIWGARRGHWTDRHIKQHQQRTIPLVATMGGIKTEEAFAKNWAQLVELPAVTRPKPLVRTPERLAHWKKTGEKPGPVMVWTPEQTGQFLDSVKGARLYSLWYTFVFSGPRRGEMCALPWPEVSLDALWLHISAQMVEVAYRQYGEAPKAESVRTNWLSLDHGEVLSRWQDQETKELNEWAGVEARVESDRAWTHENGEPLHPD